MATNRQRCALGVSLADLSAWRDHVLDSSAAQALTAHVPSCVACQRCLNQFDMLAQAMQRQRAPNLHDRVWRGMQPRMTPPRHSGFSRPALVGGLGVTLAILFVAVLVFSRHHTGGSRSLTVIPTTVTTATPQTTVTPTALTPAQAWGNYAKRVITGADISGYAIQDIFPDGSVAVGERYAGSPPADTTVFATIPTAHPTNAHVVYTTPPGAGTLFARTDGRFIAWMSTLRDSGGPDAGHQFAGYLDLQTQRVRTLANGGATNVAEMAVDHGYLLWVPEINGHTAIAVVNMLTGQSTTIVPNLATSNVPNIQLSYPYAFYVDNVTAHLYNLTTGHDAVLPQVQPQVSELNDFALAGATVFWMHGDNSRVVIDEIDQADQAGAKVQRVADYSTTSVQAFQSDLAVNDRLIAWSGATGAFAWDRAQHRLIAVAANGSGLFVRGATFAFASGSSADLTYTFIDTTKLPMAAPH